MTEKTATINNPTGLHARPASQLVNFIKTFENKVLFIFNDKCVDAKSLLNILALGLKADTVLTVRVEGDNSDDVCTKVCEYIENIKE